MADITPLGETIRAAVESQGYAVASEFEYTSDDPFEPGQVSRKDVEEAVRALGYEISGGRIGEVRVSVEPETAPKERTPRTARPKKKTPKDYKPRSTRGGTGKPKTQNAHMNGMRKDLKYDAFGVGMNLHIFCYLPSSKGTAVMSMSRIAEECGCSEATARRHTKTLIERGWFTRIDDGKGKASGAKGNVATYIPTMPKWHRESE